MNVAVGDQPPRHATAALRSSDPDVYIVGENNWLSQRPSHFMHNSDQGVDNFGAIGSTRTDQDVSACQEVEMSAPGEASAVHCDSLRPPAALLASEDQDGTGFTVDSSRSLASLAPLRRSQESKTVDLLSETQDPASGNGVIANDAPQIQEFGPALVKEASDSSSVAFPGSTVLNREQDSSGVGQTAPQLAVANGIHETKSAQPASLSNEDRTAACHLTPRRPNSLPLAGVGMAPRRLDVQTASLVEPVRQVAALPVSAPISVDSVRFNEGEDSATGMEVASRTPEILATDYEQPPPSYSECGEFPD